MYYVIFGKSFPLANAAGQHVAYEVALSLTADFSILNAIVWSFFLLSHLINIVAAYQDSNPFALTPVFTSHSRIPQRLHNNVQPHTDELEVIDE